MEGGAGHEHVAGQHGVLEVVAVVYGDVLEQAREQLWLGLEADYLKYCAAKRGWS